MDEQTSPAVEPAITTPDPVATDNSVVVEPPQAEPAPLAETAQTVTPEGVAEELPEAPTAQMGRNEPLPAPVVASPRSVARTLLDKARAVIQSRKQKKLEKIMGLFAKKPSITNDEVEKLLHVSDATATRYLSHLEQQGRIMQTGKTGHAVSYTKR
jgi:hypothetical protein